MANQELFLSPEARKSKVSEEIIDALVERERFEGCDMNEIKSEWMDTNFERFSELFDREWGTPGFLDEYGSDSDTVIKRFWVALMVPAGGGRKAAA